MRKPILILLCLMVAAPVYAAGPYLVCSPDTGATSFNVQGLPAAIPASNLPVDPSGTYGFKLDLSALPPGSYTVTATACTTDPSWGAGCSAPSVPFSLTRPATPAIPSSLGLSVK